MAAPNYTVHTNVKIQEYFDADAGAEIKFGGASLQNVGEPLDIADAATKGYVDNVAHEGHPFKRPVLAATTADIPAASFAAGILTMVSILPTQDGVDLVADDRILVKDQLIPNQNGIYVYDGNLALTRSSQANTAMALPQFCCVPVINGTENRGSTWYLSTVVTAIDVDILEFMKQSGPDDNRTSGTINASAIGDEVPSTAAFTVAKTQKLVLSFLDVFASPDAALSAFNSSFNFFTDADWTASLPNEREDVVYFINTGTGLMTISGDFADAMGGDASALVLSPHQSGRFAWVGGKYRSLNVGHGFIMV